MDETEAWSQIAAGWSRSWGSFARPAQSALIEAADIAAGTRVLDVGCGTGEFLEALRDGGATAIGVDPAPGMREAAGARGFEVHDADAAHLPFPAASFDVVAAVNSLHLADDVPAALREFARVLAPGGRIAVASWAESIRNDVDAIERAVAEADETDLPEERPLSQLGGLEAAFAEAGIGVIATGIVGAAWTASDDDALLRGILLGEDPATIEYFRAAVLAAAAPFRTPTGYVLHNALRWAVGKV